MTLGTLILEIYKYGWKDKSSATTVPAPEKLLITQAINAARKWAERDHDFSCNENSVVGVVPGDGSGLNWKASLNDRYDSGVTRKLKVVKNVYLRYASGDKPIKFTKKKNLAQEALETPVYSPAPTEAELVDVNENGTVMAVFHGNKMFLAPENAEDVNVTLDGYTWSADYSADADEDWFLEHGHDFLMWQALVQINHVTKIFVYRQEGNVMPPDKLAMLAYQAMVQLDSYEIDGNSNPDQS